MDDADPRAVLADLAVQSGEGLAALSRLLGRNAAYLQQFVKRGSPRRLAEGDRRLLARYLGIDEARLGGPAGPPMAETIAVRRLDVAALAGPGNVAEDDPVLGEARFDRQFLMSLGVRAGTVAVLRATGQSMQPLIEDGDQILVDEADRVVAAREGIFVIRIDGALMVKAVARDGAMLRISSRNPEHPALPLQHPGDVEILGRVVWLSRALR